MSAPAGLPRLPPPPLSHEVSVNLRHCFRWPPCLRLRPHSTPPPAPPLSPLHPPRRGDRGWYKFVSTTHMDAFPDAPRMDQKELQPQVGG